MKQKLSFLGIIFNCRHVLRLCIVHTRSICKWQMFGTWSNIYMWKTAAQSSCWADNSTPGPPYLSHQINRHTTLQCTVHVASYAALRPCSDVLLKGNSKSAHWGVGTCVPTLCVCKNALSLRVLSHGHFKKQRSFAVLSHCNGQNVQHGMGHHALGLMWIYAFLCTKIYFHVSAPSDLDLWHCDLEVALPVTSHMHYLPRESECCMLFCFPVNGCHRTQTGWTGCNA